MYRPADVMQANRTRDLRDGKPLHRPARQNESADDMILRSQGEDRGVVQSDGLAQNLAQLG